MSDNHWMPLRCASCKGLLKVPASDADSSVECPHCGAILTAPQFVVPMAQLAEMPEARRAPVPSRAPRKIQEIPSSAEAPRDLLAPLRLGDEEEEQEQEVYDSDSHLPPAKRSAKRYEAPEMIVEDRNASRAPLPGERDRPDLENLEKLASTDDAQFALTPEEAAQYQQMETRRRSRNVGEKLTGWDGDEAADEEDLPANRSPFANFLASVRGPAIGLLVLLLAGLIAYGYWSMNKDGDGEIPIVETENPDPETQTVADTLMMEHEQISISLTGTIRKFLGAASHEERLAFVRDPDRVRPLMEEYYATHDDGPIEYRKIEGSGALNAFKDFIMTSVEFKDFTAKNVAAERVEGEFKIDWESFVGYSEMTFDEFVEAKPAESVLFRIRMVRDNYYNYDFNDREHACFLVEDIDTGAVLYGYTKRGDKITSDLLKDVPRRGSATKAFCVLKLRFPASPKTGNQVLISEYVQKGWVLRDVSSDGKRLKSIDELEPVPTFSSPQE